MIKLEKSFLTFVLHDKYANTCNLILSVDVMQSQCYLMPIAKRGYMSNLFRYHVRMSKDFSSFFYFTLESNEGVAFYSTLDTPDDLEFRTVDVKCTPAMQKHLLNIFEQLSTFYKFLEYSRAYCIFIPLMHFFKHIQ